MKMWRCAISARAVYVFQGQNEGIGHLQRDDVQFTGCLNIQFINVGTNNTDITEQHTRLRARSKCRRENKDARYVDPSQVGSFASRLRGAAFVIAMKLTEDHFGSDTTTRRVMTGDESLGPEISRYASAQGRALF